MIHKLETGRDGDADRIDPDEIGAVNVLNCDQSYKIVTLKSGAWANTPANLAILPGTNRN